MSGNFWKNKKVFITGHTGFKGAWLTATMLQLGAKVTGYSLPAATNPSLFEQLGIKNSIKHINADINDRKKLSKAIKEAKPDIVFHLAAQSLVRYSYNNPLETFDTNVIGTVNVLEACRNSKTIKSVVIVTTDKCYLNNDTGKLFEEEDTLGGKDPYSASKAAAEIVTNAYYQSFLKNDGIAVASVRAGNVIGGGDFSEDRLIPDIIRAALKNRAVNIRNPKATRPWQFVLEPLSGYMLLAEKLYSQGHKFSGGWNFGPEPSDILPVDKIISKLQKIITVKVKLDKKPQPAEAKLLALSIKKAKSKLKWKPKLDINDAIKWTGEWYKNYNEGKSAKQLCNKQIKEFFKL